MAKQRWFIVVDNRTIAFDVALEDQREMKNPGGPSALKKSPQRLAEMKEFVDKTSSSRKKPLSFRRKARIATTNGNLKRIYE